MISLFKVYMDSSVSTEISKTLSSGTITQSQKVEDFEKQLQLLYNHPYIVTVNSATSGLTLGLRLLNLKNGDEILCPPLTCFATTCSILANNLHIKWVDIDPDTCNIDLNDLQSKISEKTKAIMVLHWAGTPIDLDRVRSVAGDIPIIEDCAHSFCAEYKGQKVGTTGNISVFSTQAIKHLTTGDGGFICLPNEKLYKRAKLLRWYGITRESNNNKDFRMEEDIEEWGYKYHMNDINATIGLCNLSGAIKNVNCHSKIANYYNVNLKGINGVKLLKNYDYSKSSNWLYTIKVKNKEKFITYMTNNNVMVSQVHKRNDKHSCVSQFSSNLPQLDELEKEIICIPCGWWVSENDASEIVKLIKLFYNKEEYSIIKIDKSYFNDYYELLREFNFKIDEKHINTLYIENCCNQLYGIIIDNKLIATAKLVIEQKIYKNVGHIEDVIVNFNYRKRKYGSVLIKHLINEAKLLDCYKLTLSCKEHLKTFYEACGMKQTGFAIELTL